MKCKFCGAEIKKGHTTCEYCGSEVEKIVPETKTIIRDSGNSAKSVIAVIGKIIIALAGIWAALIVIVLVVTLNSDAIKNTSAYAGTNATYEIPENKNNLSGQIVSYDKKGSASIDYNGHTYEDVKISDQELVKWLAESDRTIDGVEIRFTTDENGDISELGLLSPDFFIMEKVEDRYTAVRDDHVISFTSRMPLETDRYYCGYFSYPDVRLYWGKVISPCAMTYMDPKCEDKETSVEQDYYTGENITVYKIYAKGCWYYCSKETYDAVQTGDPLDEYELCTDHTPAVICPIP